jgi:hypothetical protein
VRGGYPLQCRSCPGLIGYAQVSTDVQDLTAQRDRLHGLGIPDDRVHLDHGLTGTNRERPGLDQALAQSGGFGAGRLNARRQAVTPGAAQGWHYVATFDKFHPPPMITAYLRGPDTPIEWVYSDIGPRRRARPVTNATRLWGHR